MTPKPILRERKGWLALRDGGQITCSPLKRVSVLVEGCFLALERQSLYHFGLPDGESSLSLT